MSLCSWNDSHSTSCKWPGVFSSDTHGGGRYYCIWHWRAFSLDKIDMKAEGDRAVRESLEWDGSPESYLALRMQAAQHKKPAHARAESGEEPEAAGVSRELRNDARGNAAIPIVHAAMAGMEGNLQPDYAADF